MPIVIIFDILMHSSILISLEQKKDAKSFLDDLGPISDACLMPFVSQEPLRGSVFESQFWSPEKDIRPPIGPPAFLVALARGTLII